MPKLLENGYQGNACEVTGTTVAILPGLMHWTTVGIYNFTIDCRAAAKI